MTCSTRAVWSGVIGRISGIGSHRTSAMREERLPGVRFRPTWFTPSFSKHQGVLCGGVQLHVTDRDAFQPFRTGLAVVKTLHDLYPQQFRF